MATSGLTDVSVTSWDTLRFYWERSSYSIADNTTKIAWVLELISGSSGYISSSAQKSWYVTVNGENYSGTTTIGIANNTKKTLAKGSTVIPHNSDGTKTFSYSFSQYFGITFSGKSIGTISGSGTGTLENIARKSTISVKNANIGSKTTITINRNSASFTHTLRYAFGALSGTIKTKTSETSVDWTIPTEFYTQIPAAREGYGEVHCDTYSGGTLIGTHTVRLIAYVDEATNKPTINPNAYIDANDTETIRLTGNNKTVIRYYSDVIVDTGASTKNSAYVKSARVTCGNKYINAISGAIVDAESPVFVMEVGDSREYSVSNSSNPLRLGFVEYVKPSCGFDYDIDFVKNTENDDQDKINIVITMKGKYFNGTFGAVANKLRLGYNYRVNNGEWNGWVFPDTSSAVLENDNYLFVVTIPNLEYQNTYTFQCSIQDELLYDETPEFSIKALPVYDWSENDFNFNVPVSIQGQPIADFIIDEGTRNGLLKINGTSYTTSFNYRKWQRGVIEAWCAPSFNMAVSTTYGNGFYNGSVLEIEFPTNLFKYPPIASMLVRTSDAQLYSVNLADVTNTDMSFYISSMQKQTAASSKCVDVKLYGFW